LYKVAPGGKTAGLPSGANVVLDLETSRKSTIKEFINSASMKNFVTQSRILERLREALELE
jgi:hypothetical protein